MAGQDEQSPEQRDAFDALFRSEVRSIHRYLHRRVGRGLADDLTAATFAAAFASWDRYDRARPPRPWLYGIAANLLRSHYRAEERQLRAYARTGVDPVHHDDTSEIVHRLDADAQRRTLAAALSQLRGEDREILLLHAWAELSDAEIAEALSLPLGTVKSRLHRTRERMRNQLIDSGESNDETPLTQRRELP